MTNIEEQFYKTFEIKKKADYGCSLDGDCPYENLECKYCIYNKELSFEYPQITDRILLELIRLITNKGISVYSENLDDFKNNILKFYISQKKYYSKKQVQQVQALFKGGE